MFFLCLVEKAAGLVYPLLVPDCNVSNENEYCFFCIFFIFSMIDGFPCAGKLSSDILTISQSQIQFRNKNTAEL